MVQTLILEKAAKEDQKRGGHHSGIAGMPLKVTPGRGHHLSAHVRSLYSHIAPFQEGSRVLSNYPEELYPHVSSIAS